MIRHGGDVGEKLRKRGIKIMESTACFEVFQPDLGIEPYLVRWRRLC